MAKNKVSPKDIAGSQKVKHERPHSRVRTPAMLIRLHRSLSMPIIGRPTAVPTFNSPITSVDWALVRPIDKAKSDKENRRTIYPSMLVKAQASSSITSYRWRSFVSNPSWDGRIIRFRSLINVIAARLAANAIIPVMRRAQRMSKRWIIASVPQAKAAPPTPDPAALNPLARLRLLMNHWERIGRLGMYWKPMPQPIRTPWEMCNCHIRVANEAAINPPVWKIRPASIVMCIPNLRARMVTIGATNMAIEKLKPPMKA